MKFRVTGPEIEGHRMPMGTYEATGPLDALKVALGTGGLSLDDVNHCTVSGVLRWEWVDSNHSGAGSVKEVAP